MMITFVIEIPAACIEINSISDAIAPKDNIEPIKTAYGNIINILLGILRIVYLTIVTIP